MIEMDPLDIGLIGILALLVLVFIGVRVFIAAGAVGMAGLISIIGWDAGIGMAGTIPHSKSLTYVLSVLPMFILIGYLAFHAGMTTAVFEAARRWTGWLPGGLAVATVFATAGFAAVSGASTATAAVFARTAIPEMLRHGYDRRLAAGVVAAGGTLASLIPPSAILVLYAIIVEESVGKLLLAGFIPGLISAVIYAVIISGRVIVSPELAPATEKFNLTAALKATPGTWPIVAVIAIIFGAIYRGWATPTDAGALGAFVIFSVALYRGMTRNKLKEALMETAKLTVMIFSIIWGVLVFVRFMGFAGLPAAFADFLTGLDMSPTLIIVMILIGYAILGMFMDGIGMLLLTLPIVYPAVIGLGYDPIWFGIIVVKMVEVCLITPPIGLNCYVVHGVRPDIPLQDVFRGIGLFFIADILTVALFIAYPEIITFLPDLMTKN